MPATPAPAADGDCPYLENAFVEDANGQRVGNTRISADQPNPACFFYRGDGSEQLSVWVFTGTAATARAVVDQAAPVSSSSKAQLAGGWEGGSQPTAAGAIYAVAKAGTAVVVTSNQKQTIKTRRVAEKVIETLGTPK